MFLQKYRNNNSPKTTSKDRSHNKIIDIIKKLSVPEIKNHERKNSYIDPRKYLIQNTTKMIGLKRQSKSAQDHQETQNILFNNTQELVKKPTRNISNLTSRQGRIIAAKNFRQRIWKSSDITALLRKQQQSHMRPRKIYNSHNKQYFLYDSQKTRYEDLTPQQKKQQFEKQWLQNSVKINMGKSNASSKNPQIQITNIKFNEQQPKDRHAVNYSRIYSRQRKKELKMMHLIGFNYNQKEKRPNTTGYNNRDKNQDIIEPW